MRNLRARLKRLLRPAVRVRILLHYRRAAGRRPRAARRYLLFDPELTNLTYELEYQDELARLR